MITKRFGKTNLQMPVLSLGGMRYQHKWQDVDFSEVPLDNQKNLEALIRSALEHGINHFETARAYGSSEMQMAKILQGLDRDSYILQSKVVPKEDPKEFEAIFNTTMETLGVDHLDLLAIHGVNNQETIDWTLQNGCLEVAQRLQKEGRVKHIGFSTHALNAEIMQMLETEAFSFINLHYYYVNQFNEETLKEAHRQDMGTLIISPNDKGGKLYSPPKLLADLTAPLHPMQYNALYCLSREEVGTLSIGAAKPEDFEIHLQMLEHYENRQKISQEITQKLDAQIIQALGEDWFHHWHEGLPTYLECPGNINIHEILRFYTLAKGLDLLDFGKTRYGMLGNSGHWFAGQKAENLNEAAILKACENSHFQKLIPQILQEAHELLRDEALQDSKPKNSSGNS